MAILDRRTLSDLEAIDPATIVADVANGTSAAATDAADAVAGTAREVTDAARERLDRVSEAIRDVVREVGKAGGDVRLDDVVQRLRAAVPASTIRGFVTRLERDMPDTDKDRYDRAYERGRIQARSMFLGVGVIVGVGAGIAAALLLDPNRGPARRERIAKWKDDAARQVAERSKAAAERARAMAKERGIGASKADEATAAIDEAVGRTDRDPVPVMAMAGPDDTLVAATPEDVEQEAAPVAHG